MRVIDKIKAEIEAAKNKVEDGEKDIVVDWDAFKASLAADKAYLESRISVIETRLGIIAPPPVPAKQ